MFGFPEDREFFRFNDGKCDPIGRLWVGTMHRQAEKNVGSLYCVESPLLLGESSKQNGWSMRNVLEDVTIPNGIAWSADGKSLWFIDSVTRRVEVFDYDPVYGNICDGRTAFSIPEDRGYPDGMTIDARGNLWIAHWDGASVTCYDPSTGKTLEKVKLPAPKVTSCWFGGKDLQTLYITTAVGSPDGGYTDLKEYPEAGAVFSWRTENSTGRLSPVFIG